MLKKLARYIHGYTKKTILTPLLAGLEVLMETLIPFIMAELIDKGITPGNWNAILTNGGLMLLCALLSLGFGVLAGRYAAESCAGFAANLRQGMYGIIQKFSFSNIDKFSTAGLVTRMTTDVNNVQNAFHVMLRMVVRAPLTMLCSIAMCFFINPGMSWIFLGAMVFLLGALLCLVKAASSRFRVMFECYDEVNAAVQENVTGIRVVKAFVREDHERGIFDKAVTRLYNMSIRAEKIIILNNPLMMGTMFVCMLLLSWLGANQVVGGLLTTGQLTSMFTYVMNALTALMMVSMLFVMITMSMASAQRISEVLDEEPGLKNPAEPVMKVTDGAIDFDHVSFGYGKAANGEKTLRDIDLHIASGETIGIIGSTGSGKSTLVSLISRLYDVSDGQVKVGGRDVRDYDMTVLRDNVAVVLQKNVLFSGSILENLRWGKEDATEEECRRACVLACADEFITKLPDGYNTHIEQGGNNVSGGQKQRLCIARALLKSPKILILDDSTSAVDTATDARIRKAFREELAGTTKLIIAQRISSVQDADRILVLDDGRISGFDTHDRLLETNEIYRDIYETQTKGGGDFDSPEGKAGAEV